MIDSRRNYWWDFVDIRVSNDILVESLAGVVCTIRCPADQDCTDELALADLIVKFCNRKKP
jgi:hypothetical protein